jgi:hypothetical protein
VFENSGIRLKWEIKRIGELRVGKAVGVFRGVVVRGRAVIPPPSSSVERSENRGSTFCELSMRFCFFGESLISCMLGSLDPRFSLRSTEDDGSRGCNGGRAKQQVFENSGIRLEWEIKRIGEFRVGKAAEAFLGQML